jgi:hypothetical protein
VFWPDLASAHYAKDTLTQLKVLKKKIHQKFHSQFSKFLFKRLKLAHVALVIAFHCFPHSFKKKLEKIFKLGRPVLC